MQDYLKIHLQAKKTIAKMFKCYDCSINAEELLEGSISRNFQKPTYSFFLKFNGNEVKDQLLSMQDALCKTQNSGISAYCRTCKKITLLFEDKSEQTLMEQLQKLQTKQEEWKQIKDLKKEEKLIF